MNKDEYKKLVDRLTPKENKTKNAIIAFLVGGSVGLLTESIVCILVLCFSFSRTDAYLIACLTIIFSY